MEETPPSSPAAPDARPALSLRDLDPAEVIRTAEALQRRISERFEGSSLAKICAELLLVTRNATERAAAIAEPLVFIRLSVFLFLALLFAGAAYTSSSMKLPDKEFGITNLVQLLDSALNDVVIIAAAVFSLLTLETRIKRKRALEALHGLRSLAHIIDMHQLNKDPQRIAYRERRTPSSPDEPLDAFELGRYLNYATEMLSLIGKVAALYADHLPDAVVVAGVNDIEELTTGLSQKIWQKLVLLQSIVHDAVVA